MAETKSPIAELLDGASRDETGPMPATRGTAEPVDLAAVMERLEHVAARLEKLETDAKRVIGHIWG
jgi:hypothetical protein